MPGERKKDQWFLQVSQVDVTVTMMQLRVKLFEALWKWKGKDPLKFISILNGFTNVQIHALLEIGIDIKTNWKDSKVDHILCIMEPINYFIDPNLTAEKGRFK